MKNIQIEEKHRKLKNTIEKWKRSMEQPKKTIEQLKKMKNPLEKSMKIMEINENHGGLDKNETNSETSGKVDEQCE